MSAGRWSVGRYLVVTTVLATALPFFSSWARAQGTYLSHGGPINQSMGGASTAAPVDAVGATYWNPATIAGMQNELGVGLGLLLVTDMETSSSIPGLGSGTTVAEPGVTGLPTVGWVHRREHSPLTFGLGVHAVAGFKTNYPSSATNPLFTPQSNTPGVPGGFGQVMTQAAFLQIAPMFSYAVSDKLSVGMGPTVTIGELTLDPFLFAAPDDADGSGAARYPGGTGKRAIWGGGVQLGVYYITDSWIHLGMSVKSPQWMEDICFHSTDENGLPRLVKTELDLPMIVSLGAAYTGIEKLVLALDLRYFDYKNADFWGPHGFAGDGSLQGLGMSSVMAVATGLQYQLFECTSLQGGYTFNQSPFQSAEATIAVAAPLYYQHQLHVGVSQKLSEAAKLNLAYSHYFQAQESGPLSTAVGPIPGSNVTTQVTAHLWTIGVSVKY